jgi:integrase
MKKTKRSRQGVITEETEKLIKQLQKENGKENDEYIYTCSIDALRNRVNRHLKDSLKVNHTSHDFRHGKITDLLTGGVHLKEVATYVGHSNPATTLRYFNVD